MKNVIEWIWFISLTFGLGAMAMAMIALAVHGLRCIHGC